MNDSLTSGEDYNPEDVPYWAYVVSRLPPLDNIFWQSVKLQQEQMVLLEMMINAGQFKGVTFQRND